MCGLNISNSHDWQTTRIVSPDGKIVAGTSEDKIPAVCDIDLNKKVRMYWLSAGSTFTDVHGVYKYEKNKL